MKMTIWTESFTLTGDEEFKNKTVELFKKKAERAQKKLAEKEAKKRSLEAKLAAKNANKGK